jgi:diguanylate cyclase (GGDEF)-like protein
VVQRFRAALLAFGMLALVAGAAAGVFADRGQGERDHGLREAGGTGVAAAADYLEQQRAVALVASHSAAFARFYDAPGTRRDRIEGRAGEAELMPRVESALKDLERLFPDSIASASFIDRSGAENARVVHTRPVDADDLDPDRSDALFFGPAFKLPYDQVFQTEPYRSESTGEWVIATAAKVDVGPGVSPAIVSFEITLESFRLALYPEDGGHRIRVVDRRTSDVVLDSTRPQDVDVPLGVPGDRSLTWVAGAHDGALRTDGGMRHAVKEVRVDREVETPYVLVASTTLRTGPWSGPTSSGPTGLVVAGLVLLALSVVGHLQHSRSMYRAARRDELTGLLNRRAARECAEHLLARERHLAVLLFDFDRFKNVNDSLGHHAGDHLLTVVAQRLAEVVREPDDVVARLGGDEFVVLARGVHDEDAVRVLCQRLTRAVSDPVTVDGIEVAVGVSIGVALAPEHGTDYGTLLQRADIAMYDAKSRRAGMQIFRDAAGSADRAGLVIGADLRRAIADGQLAAHYQPIMRLADQSWVGVEALVRWQHPERGLLMPGHFVPLAEADGTITAVTRTVLADVLDQAVLWRQSRADFTVSINVSAHDVTDPSFADHVAAMLAARDLPPACLVVELTETALLTDPDTASVVLWRLAHHGVQIAVDDFGAGYASLLYLRQFPVSVLKLDRTLVQGLTVDPTDAALVRWTIEMAHSLGLVCVAEGVEDAETVEALRNLGCDLAQGFHLRRPLPADDLAALAAAGADAVPAG